MKSLLRANYQCFYVLARHCIVEAAHKGQLKREAKAEEIPCRDVHLARRLQFAMRKFRLSLFAKDLEPGGSTTFCF